MSSPEIELDIYTVYTLPAYDHPSCAILTDRRELHRDSRGCHAAGRGLPCSSPGVPSLRATREPADGSPGEEAKVTLKAQVLSVLLHQLHSIVHILA